MATYTKYLSSSNSGYFGVYENSGHVEDYSYGYVGNKDNMAAFWLAFKLPADFPYQGMDLKGYEADYRDITNATLRLVEVNKGTRGSGTLNMKISPMTGPWNGKAAWNTLPAWDSSVVNTFSSFGAKPSSSYYSTRTGYHATRYKYEKVISGDGGHVAYVWLTTYNPYGFEIGDYFYMWMNDTIPAYYDYYYKYYNINVTDVAKECVKSGATGLLLWFDVSSTSYNRKVFTTTLETADTRRPGISITFGEGTGTPDLKINANGEWRQLSGLKMVRDIGGEKQWADIDGLKQVRVIDGVKQWVDIY